LKTKLRTLPGPTRRRAAQTVRELREAAGLTQERCALKCGIGLRTLRDIEAGKARMTALELVLELLDSAARATCGKVDCTAGPAIVRTLAGIEVVRIDRAAPKRRAA